MIIVQIAGRLGRDPESRFTPSGQKVTTLTVACNVRKAGKEETVWWRVTIWGDRFDKMLPYLKKGSAVIVVGEMGKPDIWTDKEGRPQVSMELTAEIVRFSPFSSGEKDGKDGNAGGTAQGNNQNQNQGQSQNNFGGDTSSNDFGSSQGYGNQQTSQGTASRYSPAAHTQEEEPLPF